MWLFNRFVSSKIPGFTTLFNWKEEYKDSLLCVFFYIGAPSLGDFYIAILLLNPLRRVDLPAARPTARPAPVVYRKFWVVCI